MCNFFKIVIRVAPGISTVHYIVGGTSCIVLPLKDDIIVRHCQQRHTGSTQNYNF